MAPLSMSMAIFIGLMCEAVLYGAFVPRTVHTVFIICCKHAQSGVYTVLAAAAFYLLLYVMGGYPHIVGLTMAALGGSPWICDGLYQTS